jgi:hypothetical protein
VERIDSELHGEIIVTEGYRRASRDGVTPADAPPVVSDGPGR